MRRALVLGDEGARHPFLKTLPPHVRRVDAVDWPCAAPEADAPEVAAEPQGAMAAGEVSARLAKRGLFRLTARDCRDFLLGYCVFFVGISAFIG
jgi:hypothetical protein